jgi:hypothetical protein
VEIGRIVVRGQPRPKVHKTPTSTNKELGVEARSCHPSYERRINWRIVVQANLGIK